MKSQAVSAVLLPHLPGDNELRIGIERHPRPYIAYACLALLRRRDALLFVANESRYLVALHPLRGQTVVDVILILRAGVAEINEELGDGVLRRARHADGSADPVPLYQTADYGGFSFWLQCVHTD